MQYGLLHWNDEVLVEYGSLIYGKRPYFRNIFVARILCWRFLLSWYHVFTIPFLGCPDDRASSPPRTSTSTESGTGEQQMFGNQKYVKSKEEPNTRCWKENKGRKSNLTSGLLLVMKQVFKRVELESYFYCSLLMKLCSTEIIISKLSYFMCFSLVLNRFFHSHFGKNFSSLFIYPGRHSSLGHLQRRWREFERIQGRWW